MRRALISLARAGLSRVGAAIVCVGLLVALGTPARAATVNNKSVRAQITSLLAQTYPGLPVGNVMCPPGVARAAGTSFTCTVQIPGTFLVIGAEQLDSSGRVKLAAQQAVIPRDKVEQFVASQATVTATVTCGPTAFLVLRPGQKIACTAAIADGSTRQVEVVVRDVDGNVAITAVT
jgi:hypothetical protein